MSVVFFTVYTLFLKLYIIYIYKKTHVNVMLTYYLDAHKHVVK